ncbi:hypothetical protein OY671_003610 [Metschnikowia pulcherrima]|nr:hypothetical protein OY671_003610 [Metschnikowia pulcherrima]
MFWQLRTLLGLVRLSICSAQHAFTNFSPMWQIAAFSPVQGNIALAAELEVSITPQTFSPLLSPAYSPIIWNFSDSPILYKPIYAALSAFVETDGGPATQVRGFEDITEDFGEVPSALSERCISETFEANFSAATFPEAVDDLQGWYTMANNGIRMILKSSPEVESESPEISVNSSAVSATMGPLSREGPDAWRRISAPKVTEVTRPDTKWHVKGRKRRFSQVDKPAVEVENGLSEVSSVTDLSAAVGFMRDMNTFKALEGLDDDAFQTARSVKETDSEEDVFLAKVLEKRQQRAVAAKIAWATPKIVPFRDTVETFRSISPDHFKAQPRDNEWQRAGGKRRRRSSIDDCDLDFDAITNWVLEEVANLAAGPIFV